MRTGEGRIRLVLAIVVATFIGRDVLAQPYPGKPIRFIVAQAAGSTSDILARIIGQKLNEALGQPVVVDIRPGAGGAIGTEMAAKAAPDGYTLLMGNFSTHAVNPSLYSKLPYDPVGDFAPVTLLAAYSHVLVAHPSLPARSVRELVRLAKSVPGQLNYGSAGNGSAQHLAGELFKIMAGVQIVHVPYKGGSPAMTAVMGGEVALMFPTTPLALPHIKAGKVRALAVTSAKRAQAAPDLPTIAEAGLPDYEMSGWLGVLAPAGTPRVVVTRLNTALIAILSLADTKTSLANYGLEVAFGRPEQFGERIKSEIAKWSKLAKEAGIRAE